MQGKMTNKKRKAMMQGARIRPQRRCLQADLVNPAELRLNIGSQRGPGGIVGAKRFDEGMVGPAVQGPVPLSSNKKTVSIQELRSSDRD